MYYLTEQIAKLLTLFTIQWEMWGELIYIYTQNKLINNWLLWQIIQLYHGENRLLFCWNDEDYVGFVPEYHAEWYCF